MFDYIKDLTECNDHTGARIEGCELLGLNELAEEFKGIDATIQRLGYLPHDLSAKSYELYQAMIGEAKKKMDADMFQEFHAAF